MLGKIIKFLLLLIFSAVVFSVASVAGVHNDIRVEKKRALAEEESIAEAKLQPQDITSPFAPYTGGPLELEIDYEVQIAGEHIYVSVISNLPDGFDLTAEISNVEAVKKQLGFDNISASALTPDQMNQINELVYNSREKNFVKDGVCTFMFPAPPSGQLNINVTSPATKYQSTDIQQMLGDKGANLNGPYVVYHEEVADKSINYTASFVISEDEL